MHYTYYPQNVCSMKIDLDVENGNIHNVQFLGGCNGNLKAISKLVEGMSAEKIASVLSGNICGRRDTSCADQLSKAVLQAAQEEKEGK